MIRFLLACLGVMAAFPASAQKSEDTIRIGMAGTIGGLSTYHDSTPASHFLSHGLYDTLIAFDERTNSYQPLLATSWKRNDDRTLEFEIRDDAKWHDGTRVDIDDVVYTLDWLSNPQTRLHLEHQWEWIDHVEKLGRTKLRLIAKRPVPYDLARLAMHIPILPEHRHGILLGEKSYFGRNPIGSGPYKFASLDHMQATVARVDTYQHGGTIKPLPKIARVQVTGGWKHPERIAEWRAGKLDVLLDADPKLAADLAKENDVRVTVVAGYGMFVLGYDARDKDRATADARVRRALDLAIDRDAATRVLPAGARLPTGLCWREQAGCGPAPNPPKQDANAARTLLKEYGHPVEIVLAAQGATAAQIAESVAQSWRSVGVAVRIENASPEELYIRVRDNGLDAAIFPWHGGAMPDVHDTVQTFFAPNFWDLHADPALHALAAASSTAIDDATRRDGTARALALNAATGYVAPIAPMPAIAVHKPDVAIDARGRWQTAGFNILDLSWR